MTSREAISQAAVRIQRRDAEVLLAHALGRDRAWLRAHDDEALPTPQLEQFFALVEERSAHKPLQYLTGQQEFYGLPLQLSPATLIPRPETELLVEAVLAWAAALRPKPHPNPTPDRPLQIADVGTGSGAIALALATHLPRAQLHALDKSHAVAPIVEANIDRLGLRDRVHFEHSDLLSALAPWLADGNQLDAVVSNPPYIPSGDALGLAPEILHFEPHSALFAGPDGLKVYRRLIPEAANALRPGGLLALEFGFGQRHALETLLGGWERVQFLDDLAGIPRVALAFKA